MRYGIGGSLLLTALSPADSFHFCSLVGDIWGGSSLHRLDRQLFALQAATQGYVSSTNNATANSLYLANLVTDAVQTDDDAEEIVLAERRRKITQRSGSYRVTLPLSPSMTGAGLQTMGITIRQFVLGREISEKILNLDNLTIETNVDSDGNVPSDDGSVETISVCAMQGRLDPYFAGLYVSSVAVQSPAWKAGVRPGDMLMSTAITFGEALWPKTTLEGVRSALKSRKMVSDTATFDFKRTAMDKADNIYELTLVRPIGLNLRETQDGYVEIAGFTNAAPTLIRRACRIGDRVIAVDSSLGDRMWPVSTVEGVISACTSRLPGQQVTLRFERPEANLALAETLLAEAEISAPEQLQASTTTRTTLKADEQQLLKRCRDILRRYAAEEKAQSSKIAGTNFVDKYAVPAIVADKVLEAVATASASMDGITLSMVMGAYLSVGKPEGAIRAFEAAVGFNGDGSIVPVDVPQNEEGAIRPNSTSLTVFTISSLLKAHAMKRDLKSVRRVVAAMEGRGGEKVSGLETAKWPGAGAAGVIVPDTQCYNIAISAAAKAATSDGLQLAMKLFNGLHAPSVLFRKERINSKRAEKPEKNAITYNSIIGALTLAGQFDDAFSVFFNMKQVGLKPDKFTYTSLLKACVNDGDLQELLYDMKEQGVKDDVVIYNALIRSLCDEGKLGEARTLISQMESRNIRPDSKTYGILMKGLLKANKPGACLALFETACNNDQTSQLTENVYLYTTAVTAASSLRDHDRAIDLVSRMTALGIKPNYKTLTALMGACLSNQRPELAAEVYKRIQNPDGYAMFQGLEAYCLSGDLTAATKLLSAQKRGSRILSGKQLVQGYEILIAEALRLCDYRTARRMFAELLEKSFIPSKAMLRRIIDAMGVIDNGQLVLEYVERQSVQFEFLLFLIDSMEKRNIALDSFLYAATIACGNQIGGRHREVSLLLMQSKAAFDVAVGECVPFEDKDEVRSEPVALRWEEVLLNDDIFKMLVSNSALLPSLAVTVGKLDARAVFFAEKFMSRPMPAAGKAVISQS